MIMAFVIMGIEGLAIMALGIVNVIQSSDIQKLQMQQQQLLQQQRRK